MDDSCFVIVAAVIAGLRCTGRVGAAANRANGRSRFDGHDICSNDHYDVMLGFFLKACFGALLSNYFVFKLFMFAGVGPEPHEL